jgi:hypothetical protein
MNVTNKDIDQASNDRNINSEVKLHLNTEKNGNMNKQTGKESIQ